MNDKDFRNELKFIMKGSLILNMVVYVVSLILKLNISTLIGLLLGTLILYINLHLLRRNLDYAVMHGSNRMRLMIGYLIRYLLIGSAFYFATRVGFINPFGIVIVQLYPRVLYTFKSILEKKGVVKM